MEFIIIGMVLFTFCTGMMWYKDAQLKNRLYEKLLKDFVNILVPCRLEIRDRQFYIYNGLTDGFVAQGKTPNEVAENLPNDGKIYMDWTCKVGIMEMVELEYTKDKALVQ